MKKYLILTLTCIALVSSASAQFDDRTVYNMTFENDIEGFTDGDIYRTNITNRTHVCDDSDNNWRDWYVGDYYPVEDIAEEVGCTLRDSMESYILDKYSNGVSQRFITEEFEATGFNFKYGMAEYSGIENSTSESSVAFYNSQDELIFEIKRDRSFHLNTEDWIEINTESLDSSVRLHAYYCRTATVGTECDTDSELSHFRNNVLYNTTLDIYEASDGGKEAFLEVDGQFYDVVDNDSFVADSKYTVHNPYDNMTGIPIPEDTTVDRVELNGTVAVDNVKIFSDEADLRLSAFIPQLFEHLGLPVGSIVVIGLLSGIAAVIYSIVPSQFIAGYTGIIEWINTIIGVALQTLGAVAYYLQLMLYVSVDVIRYILLAIAGITVLRYGTVIYEAFIRERGFIDAISTIVDDITSKLAGMERMMYRSVDTISNVSTLFALIINSTINLLTAGINVVKAVINAIRG